MEKSDQHNLQDFSFCVPQSKTYGFGEWWQKWLGIWMNHLYPFKAICIDGVGCEGQNEGFVWFKIKSSRVCAVSKTLRAHLQSSAERMEMRLKQACIKCHHSLHTNTVAYTRIQTFKVKHLHAQQCLCISFFSPHNRCYNSTTKRASCLPEGLVYFFFICLVT